MHPTYLAGGDEQDAVRRRGNCPRIQTGSTFEGITTTATGLVAKFERSNGEARR
jgi:hypothetical protein